MLRIPVLHVLSDPQFARIAAFGSFAVLGMADFSGPARSWLMALRGQFALGNNACVLAFVVAVTRVADTPWWK